MAQNTAPLQRGVITTDRSSSPQAAPVPGLVRLDERQIKWQRIAILFLTLGPLAGFIAAVISLWGTGLSMLDVTLFLIFYMGSGLGITVGFHRLFTHQSFDAPDRMRTIFAVMGSFAIQGSVISWVADHRRHHAFSDKEGDPHSPHLQEGEGFGAMVKGLWHAHVGWFTDEERTERERWAPDLLKDETMRKIDRVFPWIAITSFVLPGVIGLVVTRSIWGGVTAFLWASLARVMLLHHVTWSINSICHFFGRRPYETTDMSTNNWPLAIISFGESWHNNHHAFPTSAVHGLGRFQPDMSGAVIRLLERVGLASDVKTPSEKQLASKSS